MGLAAASHFIVNVAITEAGPTAFVSGIYYYMGSVRTKHHWDPAKHIETLVMNSDIEYLLTLPSSIQATIKQNYYYVFVGCTLFFLVCAYFFFLETRNKTLEQIGETFGDKVVALTENDVAAEQNVFEEKAKAGHVEKD